MTIELSTITFTHEDDIVPASGEDAIVNTGNGSDTITGTGGYGL